MNRWIRGLFVLSLWSSAACEGPDERLGETEPADRNIDETGDDEGADGTLFQRAPATDGGRPSLGRRDGGIRLPTFPGLGRRDGGTRFPTRDSGIRPRLPSDAGRDASTDAGSSSIAVNEACVGLTYQSFGQSFFNKYCGGGCHEGIAAFGGVDLSSLDTIRISKQRIIDHAVQTPENKPMPPISIKLDPTPEERTQLGQWLACGPN